MAAKNNIKNWFDNHPHYRLLIGLAMSGILAVCSFKVLEIVVIEALKIPYGMQIVGIIFGCFIANFFFWSAYEMQDDAWYRWFVYKTGDDFEERYDNLRPRGKQDNDKY